MRLSPKVIFFILATLVWLVVGWPFNRRYHPMAESTFETVFVLGVFLLPIFLDWLERRKPHH
jgi:hypothetical protein